MMLFCNELAFSPDSNGKQFMKKSATFVVVKKRPKKLFLPLTKDAFFINSCNE